MRLEIQTYTDHDWPTYNLMDLSFTDINNLGLCCWVVGHKDTDIYDDTMAEILQIVKELQKHTQDSTFLSKKLSYIKKIEDRDNYPEESENLE